MSRLRIIIVITVLLALASGGSWLALRDQNQKTPMQSTTAAGAILPVSQKSDTSDAAFLVLVSAPAGRVTPNDVERTRARLLDGSDESRHTLELELASPDSIRRLVAFRLLLERDGWSLNLSNQGAADPSAMLRAEASDWLYVTSRFQERTEFLARISPMSVADYQELKPAIQHLRWAGLPAGADILGIGRGIDRYLIELFRASDTAFKLVTADLLSSELSPPSQSSLLRLLHVANRPSYESFLKSVATGTDDTPLRYEAIWLLGTGFPTVSNRELFAAHMLANSNDPLLPRLRQAVASIDAELTVGRTRLDIFEGRLAAALNSGARGNVEQTLSNFLDEAVRQQKVADKSNLTTAKMAVASPGSDYGSRRRIADIEFLLWKQ